MAQSLPLSLRIDSRIRCCLRDSWLPLHMLTHPFQNDDELILTLHIYPIKAKTETVMKIDPETEISKIIAALNDVTEPAALSGKDSFSSLLKMI